MEIGTHRINVRTMRKLGENDGLTLRKGHPVTYKSGWQVAEEGCIVRTPEAAMAMVRMYKGNCGIWLYEGKYYIDPSRRVSTKHEALEVGRANNQLTVLKWATMEIIDC